MKYILTIGYPENITKSKVKNNYKKLSSVFPCDVISVFFKKGYASYAIFSNIVIETDESEESINSLLEDVLKGKYSDIFTGILEIDRARHIIDKVPPNYTGYNILEYDNLSESIKPMSAKEALYKILYE